LLPLALRHAPRRVVQPVRECLDEGLLQWRRAKLPTLSHGSIIRVGWPVRLVGGVKNEDGNLAVRCPSPKIGYLDLDIRNMAPLAITHRFVRQV
jgi:hypothetical protein